MLPAMRKHPGSRTQESEFPMSSASYHKLVVFWPDGEATEFIHDCPRVCWRHASQCVRMGAKLATIRSVMS